MRAARPLLPLLALYSLAACDPETPPQDPIVLLPGAPDVMDMAPSPADFGEPDIPEPPDTSPLTPDVQDMPEDVPEPPPVVRTLANGIAITKVEAYQTTRVPVMEDGASATSATKLVANRETLLRAFVEVEPGWTPQEIEAEFVIEDGGETEVFANTLTISGSSDVWQRASIFEARVPPSAITTMSRVHVRLIGDGDVDAAGAQPSPARWPPDGVSTALGATEETGRLEIVLVPIRWDRDGSGRMPDTSPAQLERLERAVRAIYPMAELDLSVREPISWSGRLDWGDFNVELRRLKQADGRDEAYYYGMVSPAEDFDAYCSGRCTTGQSFTVSNASASSYRVGTGVGFTGDRWAWTFVHELGHMHGRGHAPCGVSFFSRDRGYPHAGGDIGEWGWDARSGILYGPEGATDFMGYCDELWVSDYTYQGIYDRMAEVWSRSGLTLAQGPERAWRWLAWSDEAPTRWGEVTFERVPHTGEVCEVRGDQGQVLGDAPLARMSHRGEMRALVLESWVTPGQRLSLSCDGSVVHVPSRLAPD